MSSRGWVDLFAPRVLLESVPGGIDVRDFSESIADFKYVMTRKKMDKLTLTIANIDMRYANDPRFDGDMRFLVRWGYPGGLSSVKEVVVSQVAPNLGAGVPQLVMTCLDVGQNLTSTGARNWGAVQSSDIAQSLARRYNLQADIVPSGDRRHEHRIQTAATTDYEFLARLADRINYDFWTDQGTLHFKPVDTSAAPRHRFVYYLDGSSTLKSFHPTIKKGKTYHRHVGGATHGGGSSVAAPVRAATTRALGSHSVSVLNINSRTARASLGTVTTRSDEVTSPSPETDPIVRERHAGAVQHKVEMGAVTMVAELVGYPAVEARDIIDIYVIERRYSGLWKVEEATHHIGSHGYTTSLKLKRAEVNASPSVVSGSQVPVNERNPHVTNSAAPPVELGVPIDLVNARASAPQVIQQRSPVTAPR